MNPRTWFFTGAGAGQFRISSMRAVRGEALPTASHLHVGQNGPVPRDASFVLRGVVSNERYTARSEKAELVS
jgi:hypothetical protein